MPTSNYSHIDAVYTSQTLLACYFTIPQASSYHIIYIWRSYICKCIDTGLFGPVDVIYLFYFIFSLCQGISVIIPNLGLVYQSNFYKALMSFKQSFLFNTFLLRCLQLQPCGDNLTVQSQELKDFAK